MKEEDKQEAIRRYSERLAMYGHTEKTLGWSRNKNDVRFEALVSEWVDELEDSSIADFGCGFGDLYGFLLNSKKLQNVSYVGIDINEELVNVGRGRYPQAEFWVGDIVKEEYNRKFDFIFSSGVFNHRLAHDSEYHFIQETLTRVNQMTTKGFAINFLSDKVDRQANHTFHSNPGRILDMIFNFSRHVVLRNDYMPFEFTVYVRKDIGIDTEKVIFLAK